MPPKYMSGYQKKKRKLRIESLIQSQAGDINKYFTPNLIESKYVAENLLNNEEDMGLNDDDKVLEPINMDEMGNNNNEEVLEPLIVDESNFFEKDDELVQHETLSQETCYDDPGKWGNIDQKIRDFLVERGPKRDACTLFPKDSTNRHFNVLHYKRILSNGEENDRRWLLYSISLDKIFCFCCKLFKKQKNKIGTQLANEGYNDWHNLSRCLTTHEASKEHMECMADWLELERRLQKNQTIDARAQVQLNKEKEHWKHVLHRIIAIVQRLAKNNLAFRGKLYVENNGLFLQMVEMIAEFDPIMNEHLRRIKDHETYTTYLGSRIQNELIQMLAGEVRKKLLAKVKKAKYFSVILDCTSDISHKEQMSLVIWCLDESENSTKVKEYWIEFLEVDDTSGLGLFMHLKDALIRLELDIDDIRGQGYNNGSNMKGKHKGVQRRLLEINLRAFYTPCGCHSLNLALCDMVNCCPQAMSFFGVIQRIYTLFSSSTKRWRIFKDHVKGLTVKPLSQTRWESHVESVKPIKEQTAQIRDVLLDLTNDTEDPKTKSEAESLALYELEKFEFLLGVVIWYKLLFAINTASKLLQSENMDIDIAIKLLQGIIIFLEEYRESGFDKAMVEAKEMASEMGIEAVFREKRVVRRKKQFDESSSTEIALSAEEFFRVNYFIFIVDQAHSSIESRFAQFKKYQEIFGFLFNVERLQCSDDESLLRSCGNLESSLAHNGCSVVNGDDLFSELTFLKCSLPNESKSAIDVLDYLKKMDGCFPNAHVAYKILLTILVTVAISERSFSKLKLIKTFLR
ncbi:52 kDa repressor of the inhibitor of the protein kinase-like [Zingiber officinale]|uniref:52 kDa repressor of the inhibitor of the protein kinase-like n=1 Tax=Zingiber officinale TaxID=94328 RepID=UPI001C4D24CB|nr:52 kDa repressor of the inhibitor of the protein kinase-like [Zingiber officinale]